jgi:DNA polymerase
LDRAIQEAGLDRSEVYITNVVKHFRFEERGKRRIHKKPSAAQVKACRPWLDAELEAVHPMVLVCLGATAAQAILGSGFRLTEQRGVPFEHQDRYVVATAHPSAVLRAPDSAQRHEEYARLVADLKKVRALL